jgi:hypothetical protein
VRTLEICRVAVIAICATLLSANTVLATPPPTTAPPILPPTAPTPTGGFGGIGGSEDGGGGAAIVAAVVVDGSATASSGGGLGGRPCTPWVATSVSGVIGGDTITGYTDDAGQTWKFYTRTCDGLIETEPFPVVTGRETALGAMAEVRQQLPTPTAAFAPPLDKMIVNFETWMGVAPVDPVTATATVITTTASVTATPNHIEWHTGSIVTGDTTLITCNLWGSTQYPTGGCTWTPSYPSVPKATGTDDLHYHGNITIIWDITWTATDGTTGTFPQLRTTSPVITQVLEIQTM